MLSQTESGRRAETRRDVLSSRDRDLLTPGEEGGVAACFDRLFKVLAAILEGRAVPSSGDVAAYDPIISAGQTGQVNEGK